MRGRKRQQKKEMKKMLVKGDYTLLDLMDDSRKVFEELLINIRRRRIEMSEFNKVEAEKFEKLWHKEQSE